MKDLYTRMKILLSNLSAAVSVIWDLQVSSILLDTVANTLAILVSDVGIQKKEMEPKFLGLLVVTLQSTSAGIAYTLLKLQTNG